MTTRGRLVALGVAIVAAAANVVLLASPEPRSDGLDANQAAAVDSARQRLAAMLTVRHEDVEGDLAVASANATGPFRETYAERLRSLVGPGWAKTRTSMTSTVATAGVAGVARSGSVAVEALVDTDVASDDRTAEQQFRVRAIMQRVGDQWLVADLTLL